MRGPCGHRFVTEVCVCGWARQRRGGPARPPLRCLPPTPQHGCRRRAARSKSPRRGASRARVRNKDRGLDALELRQPHARDLRQACDRPELGRACGLHQAQPFLQGRTACARPPGCPSCSGGCGALPRLRVQGAGLVRRGCLGPHQVCGPLGVHRVAAAGLNAPAIAHLPDIVELAVEQD